MGAGQSRPWVFHELQLIKHKKHCAYPIITQSRVSQREEMVSISCFYIPSILLYSCIFNHYSCDHKKGFNGVNEPQGCKKSTLGTLL